MESTQAVQRSGGTESHEAAPPEERVREERKRYTTQLQRRAQAHVTAELGGPTGEAEIDRQVTMVIQHALDAAGARRVSLFRPVPRGRRWHVATVLDDGCFYYGQTVAESVPMPVATFERQRPVMLSQDRPHDPQLPRLSELGYHSYLGVPIKSHGQTVAVLEAIDIAQPDNLERITEAINEAVAVVGDHLASDASVQESTDSASAGMTLSESTVLDLVIRPAIDSDDVIAITPQDWAVLNQLDGDRPLSDVAKAGGVSVAQAAGVAEKLLQRGLIRVGREGRRRL